MNERLSVRLVPPFYQREALNRSGFQNVDELSASILEDTDVARRLNEALRASLAEALASLENGT